MSAVLSRDERQANFERALEQFAEWVASEFQLPPTMPASCAEILARVRERQAPRFAETFCSSCGRGFGPGDHGFSHCDNHAHLIGRI